MGVLIKPLVTEKVSAMNEHGKYGFVVSHVNSVIVRYHDSVILSCRGNVEVRSYGVRIAQ